MSVSTHNLYEHEKKIKQNIQEFDKKSHLNFIIENFYFIFIVMKYVQKRFLFGILDWNKEKNGSSCMKTWTKYESYANVDAW